MVCNLWNAEKNYGFHSKTYKLTGSRALMATKTTFTAVSGFVAMSLFVTLLQGLHIYCLLFTFSARTGNLDFH